MPLLLLESTLILKLRVVLMETPDARSNIVDSESPVPVTETEDPAGKPVATE